MIAYFVEEVMENMSVYSNVRQLFITEQKLNIFEFV